MKNKFLKLDNPCSKKWGEMKPNDQGSFCNLCSKNVIDFTNLSQDEISKTINRSGNNLCVRLTKTQLEAPIWSLERNFEFTIPKSNIAAGLMLVTSLSIGHTLHAENHNVKAEISQSSVIIANTKKEKIDPKTNEKRKVECTVFRGKITSEDLGNPVENAKITFVTSQKLISAYTSSDGTFSFEIPTDLIDNDNVIRVNYNDVNENRERFFGYETMDYILTKKELTAEYNIQAIPQILYVGGIGAYSEKSDPIVLSNGVEIKYRDFVKAKLGEKSSCSLENKDYLYFSSKFAIAIYGNKAKDGLYLLINKTEK